MTRSRHTSDPAANVGRKFFDLATSLRLFALQNDQHNSGQ